MNHLKGSLLLSLLFCSWNANALPIRWTENGHYYDVVQYRADYATAKKLVDMLDNPAIHLAKIDSAEENTFLLQHHPMMWSCYDPDCQATFTNGVWLGGQQTDTSSEPADNWMWSDGGSLLYQNWKEGEPNNTNGDENCLAMTMLGTWNDQNCGAVLEGFIVEYEVEPDESGYLKMVPLQWREEEGGNNHWYQRVLFQSITWESAKIAAEQASLDGVKGHLATVTSEGENAFLITSFLGRSNNPCVVDSMSCSYSLYWRKVWLGGQWDEMLKVTWITGEESAFTLPLYPPLEDSTSVTGGLPVLTTLGGAHWFNPMNQPSFADGYLIEYEPSTTTEHPLESNECTATYSPITGKLIIPCLKVDMGNTVSPLYYQLQMQQGDNFGFGVEWDTLQAR